MKGVDMNAKMIHAMYMALVFLIVILSLIGVVVGNQRLQNRRAEVVLPDIEIGRNYYVCDKVHGGIVAKHWHVIYH